MIKNSFSLLCFQSIFQGLKKNSKKKNSKKKNTISIYLVLCFKVIFKKGNISFSMTWRPNYRVTENEERRATFRGCCNNPKEKRCGPGPSLWQKQGKKRRMPKDVEEEPSEKSTWLRIGAVEERRVRGLPGSRWIWGNSWFTGIKMRNATLWTCFCLLCLWNIHVAMSNKHIRNKHVSSLYRSGPYETGLGLRDRHGSCQDYVKSELRIWY